MVNRIAAKLSPSVRAAAAFCSAGWPGDPKKHIERLRTRYRVLQGRGLLPAEETPASRRHDFKDAVRAMYEAVDAKIEAARLALGPEEYKAGSRGLDIGENLDAVLIPLERQRDNLRSLLGSGPDYAFAVLREKGLTVEAAMAEIDRADSDLLAVEEKIELLNRIKSLRSIARIRK
jgi:hypothetical protein